MGVGAHRHRSARPAPDDVADRPGGRVRGIQLPARLLDAGRRHGVGAGGRLPGRRQGASGPSRDRRLAAGAIAGAVSAVGLPAATFQQLAGDVALGTMLVAHPEACAVAFTGSLAAGRALYDVAAARATPIPVYAEMGSVNPVFVLPGALGERGSDITAGLADSVVLGAGQFCTNPGVVVAIDAADFAGRLAAELATRPPAAMLTPSIAGSYSAAVPRAASHPERRGARRVRGRGGAGVRARRRRRVHRPSTAPRGGVRTAHDGRVVCRRGRAAGRGRPRRGSAHQHRALR